MKMSEFDDEETIELTSIDELGKHNSTELASIKYSESTSNALHRETKYELLETIGKGAMGEILLARDQSLRRKVAYKKIHKNMSNNFHVMSRFFTEAQITAQLDHPNIVPVYSLEVSSDGEIAYSMKLIKGNTLKDLMTGAKKQYKEHGQVDEEHSLQALLEHFLKVCDAMHFSHMKGVIHRDLKPANIMIGPYNEVYVMDWGIAKVIAQSDEEINQEIVQLIQPDSDEPPMERTQMGAIIGTPRYLSPQQAAGKNDTLDARSDQFTLGIILFELLTLKPAFYAKEQIELIKKILKVDLNSFSHYKKRNKIPGELQAIVLKATEKSPDKRYISVEALADDIRRYLRGEAIAARPDTIFQKSLRWMTRHRELTLAIFLTISIIGSSVTIWSLYQQQISLRREQTSLKQAQEHKQKLSQFLLAIGRKAQIIDGKFIRFESILKHVAGSLSQLIENGHSRHDKYYLNSEFYTKGKEPPDLVDSKFYKFKMSTHWNVFKLAPGVQRADVDKLLRKVSPIRHVLKQALLESSGKQKIDYSDQEVLSILEKGLPVLWVYAGLKEGIQLTFPGRGTFPPEYDTRKRPWFIESRGLHGPHWIKPYLDVHGKGWVLPCTLPMYDSSGEFLGVAALELTLDYIKKNYLNLNLPGFQQSYLLNQQGQVIVSSKDIKSNYKKGTILHQSKQLKPYPVKHILNMMKTQTSGYFEDEKHVIVFYQIPSLNWFYLAEASAEYF